MMRGSAISTLFLLNPTFKAQSAKPTDEEETLAKVLFYFPESAPGYEITGNVGLAEGLMMFVKQFTETPLQSCSTERCTHMVKRFEESVWLYVVIQHPPQGEGLVKAQDLYCTEEVMNRVMDGFYQGFYLFHGALEKYSSVEERERLKGLLSDYNSTFMLEFANEEEFFPGFYYCPMDRKAFLMVQFQVNQILTERREVKHIMILYEGYYVSSSLPHAHSSLLYRYLAKERNWRRIATLNRGYDPTKCLYGRVKGYPERGFLYGLAADGEVFAPLIQFPFDPEGTAYRLAVWAEDSTQYVLLLDPDAGEYRDYDSRYFRELGDRLQQQVALIHASVTKQVSQASALESPYRFFYFNNMNFAIKRGGRIADFDQDLLHVVRSVSAQFCASGDSADTMVKSVVKVAGGWVCCLNSMSSRQVYLLVPGTQTVQKVEEELGRFVQDTLQNIFLGVKY